MASGAPFDGSAAQSNNGNSTSGPRRPCYAGQGADEPHRIRNEDAMAMQGRKKRDTMTSAADAVDLERLRRDLDAADAERADAVRARNDLDDRRDDVLATEDVAALERYEIDLAATERRIAVADTRCVRLASEIETAVAASEQASRRAAYDAAAKGLTEARRLISVEYVAAAQKVAEILERAKALRNAAIEANKALPADAEPLDTILEEGGFNGRHYRGMKSLKETKVVFVNKQTGLRAGPCDMPEYTANAHKWRREEIEVERPLPMSPATAHRSVIDFCNLPNIDLDNPIFSASAWGRPRAGDVEEAPVFGLLR